MIWQDNKPAAPYKRKPFPQWDKMIAICEGASATGEDAFHPGESILEASESFQELKAAASNASNDEPEVSDDGKNDFNEPVASDDEVCSDYLSTQEQDHSNTLLKGYY